MTGEEAFRAALLPWAQQYRQERGTRVVEVTKVETTGSDWAGSTESGWHSETETEVTIVIEQTEADDRWTETLTVDGEGMADLWNWVIEHYPAATP